MRSQTAGAGPGARDVQPPSEMPADRSDASGEADLSGPVGSMSYVYAVIRGHDRRGLWTLPCTGVSGAPVSVLPHNDLAAVVSAVSIREFGPEALPGKLQDAMWVATSALAHHLVLESLLGRCAVAPLTFGTLCRDAETVGEMVAERYREFDDALARVDGATEWDVKVSCERSALLELLSRTHPRLRRMADDAAALPEGAAYFLRRKAGDEARQEADALVTAHALEVHAHLADVARGAVAHEVRPQVTHPEGPETILHEAYLVADEDRERFLAAVAALRQASGPSGLALAVSGPWPAYSFVRVGPVAPA